MYPLVTADDVRANAFEWLIGKPLAVTALILLGLVVRFVVHRMIDRLVRRAAGGILPQRLTAFSLRGVSIDTAMELENPADSRRVQRSETLGSLLKSIVTGVVFSMVAMMVLSQLGADIAPILASAGILGVALGFGSQALVKDFLSGIFMIFEDQYGVGDVVDLGEATGTVEAVTLRITRLRDIDGTVWYVRNGEIPRVGNRSQNWARTVLDVSVGYGEDLARVRQVLEEVAVELSQDEHFKPLVIEAPEVWGVQDLAADGVTVRVAMKTAPLQQWAVARELRQRVKTRFDADGIEIPFQQRVVWHRGDEPSDQPANQPADQSSGPSVGQTSQDVTR